MLDEIKNNFYNYWWLPALLGLIVFSGVLNNGFTNWDDPNLVLHNKNIRELDIDNLKKIFNPSFSSTYQPFRTLSYAFDFYIGGKKPFVYHLHNLLLYILNILLIYFIIKELFGNMIAFWGSSFFAVHPIHVEPVAWVAARKDVLSGLFFFLAFFLYIKFTQKKDFYLYLLSFLSFIVSLLSKPSAVVFPVVIIVYDLIFLHNYKIKLDNIVSKLKYYIPYWIPNLAIIVYFMFFAGAKKSYIHGGNLFWTLSTDAFIVLKYFTKLVIPLNLLPRYQVSTFSSINLLLIISIAINLGILIVAFINLRKRKILSFSILWFYICLIPVSNIVPISTLMADRYIYLSSFGFVLILGYLFYKLLQKPKWVNWIFILYFLFLSFQAVQYTDVWKTSKSLWQHTVEIDPQNPIACNQLGHYYLTKEKDTLQAYNHFKRAIKANPSYIQAIQNYSVTALALDKDRKAIKNIKRGLQYKPNSLELKYLLGTIYNSKERYTKALKFFKGALKSDSQDVNTLISLGNTYYFSKSNYKKAIHYYEKAYKIDNNRPLVIKRLAEAYYKLNDLKKAIKYYELYLKVKPDASKKDLIQQKIRDWKTLLDARVQ